MKFLSHRLHEQFRFPSHGKKQIVFELKIKKRSKITSQVFLDLVEEVGTVQTVGESNVKNLRQVV